MLGKAVALPCHTHCLAPRTGVGSRGLVGLYSKAATHDEPRCSPDLQEGTEVVGTVVWAGPKGAKVLLANKVMGFMPMREAPFVIRDSLEEPAPPGRTACTLPKGLVRPFKVIGGQSTLSKPKSGPLLSARLCDLDVLWQRAAQLCDISTQHKENMRVIIDGANSGGLLARFNGLSMFVPVSQLGRKGHNEWWTEQDMATEYAGQEVCVAVLEVVRDSRKVVCSIAKARENDDLRQLEVGSLVTGTVRRIEPFGVFVGINNTRISGLLHISNVSRRHIDTVDGMFEIGEEVKCLIMGMEPGYTNISLSIAELELQEGDVLTNRQRVWQHAHEQASAFKAELERLQAEGYDFSDSAVVERVD